MAYQENIEEILLRIKTEGQGELDKWVQGLKQLHHNYGEILQKLASGDMAADKAAAALRRISGAAASVSDQIAKLDPEVERLQATLKRMDQESSASAAEALRMRGQASREVVENLHLQAQATKEAAAQQAADMAALHARLKEMNDRDRSDAAEAAALRKVSTRDAIDNLTQQRQAEQQAAAERAADMAALHARLKEMNDRDRADAAESAAMRGRASRTVVEGLHAQEEGNRLLAASAREAAEAELARYQAALKAMQLRGGEERSEAERRNTEALLEGTRAVRERMRADDQRIADEKQAADDLAAVRSRLGQMEAADAARTQEQLRETAAQRMQEVQSAVEGAKRKDAAIEESFAREKAARLAVGRQLGDQMRSEGAEEFAFIKRRSEAYQQTLRSINKGNEQVASTSKSASYALLNIAHAAQDAQYGFGALLNNVPLVVQAFGGGPGLAGTLMLVGVGFEVLKPHITGFLRDMGMIDDASKRGAVGLDGMKDRLAALTERPWKLDADFAEIREAEKAVEKLERRVNAAKGMMGEGTTDQEASGREVREIIKDFAGGGDEATGMERLTGLVRESRIKQGGMQGFLMGDPEYAAKAPDILAGIERQRARISDPESDILTRNMARGMVMKAEKAMASLRDRADRNLRQQILGEIGQALEGNERGIGNLAITADANKGMFTRTGVDPAFAQMLLEATPPEVRRRKGQDEAIKRAEESRRAANEIEQSVRRANVRAGQELEQRLGIESKIGHDAWKNAQELKAKMGAQVVDKPVQPPPTPASPVQRRREAIGRFAEARRARLADQVAMNRPDLAPDQVANAAQAAGQLVARGWNETAAVLKVVGRLNEEILRAMQTMAGQNAGLMGGFQQQGQRVRGIQRGIQNKRPSLIRQPWLPNNR